MNLLTAPPPMRRPASEPGGSRRSGDGRFEHLLTVEFDAPTGERWSSLGAGRTLGEAIEVAREALPLGIVWDVARWRPLYGE